MTFLEEIKEELLNIRLKSVCCMKSELRGILLFGSMPYMGSLIFGTDSFSTAKRVSMYLKRVCDIGNTEKLSENADGYKFLIPEDILERLDLKIDGVIKETNDAEQNECCKRAFVRGAFLAAGSAANPEKAYRMEIFSEEAAGTEKVLDILESFGVEAKITQRKNLWVVYANNSTSVGDFLKVTEANRAVFAILDVIVKKEKRNSSNRLINCDMANADRAVNSASREIQAIKQIEKTMGIDFLKPKLKEIALLRLENPDASLKELGNMFDPPLPKSTVNNRLNKIIEIAKGIE